jgi:mannose-6-phosphate isomerase-like protein (cupin superfamily)
MSENEVEGAERWERYGLPGPAEGETMGMYAPIAPPSKPKFFNLRAQLLEEGRSLVPLAETESLWSWIKVYATGGENTLHAHPNEDHMFVVLAGQATFFGPDDEEKNIGRHQGLMLPAGTLYRFHASGDEPLVLLRVGARGGDGALKARLGADGQLLPGGSKRNKFSPPVYKEGAYFE